MKLNRVMIAAPKSGSGKTMITCALLQALKEQGKKVMSYKCGPDYIDPMFHEKVIGVPAKNLDTYFTGEEETKRLFLHGIKGDEVAVLEGVMGLFDGLSGIREEGSSYHLAKVTKTPIILVVDVKGMGYSMIPLLAGFLSYDKEHLIKGVILNKISKGYYERIKPLIEENLPVSVLGFLKEEEEMHIGSRHLGLKLPEEIADIRKKIKCLSEEFCKTVSVLGIMEIAEEAGEIVCAPKEAEVKATGGAGVKAGRPVICVARDEAFCFYYEDNLSLLKEYGAEIRYFSPIHDKALPKECHALLLGGGYPELYAKELSENHNMRMALRRAIDGGMPTVAECGGFMYLHSTLKDQKGISHAMVGSIFADCFYTGKLVRFGYIELEGKDGYFLPKGEKIKGHEFHYFDSTDNGDCVLARKPVTGRAYSCIIEGENFWAGFPHLYYPSNPEFARAFVEKAGR